MPMRKPSAMKSQRKVTNMSGFNMPPGVSPSDIPGNRPEDEAFDLLCALASHIVAMADDAYLVGHPEWIEITSEARIALREVAA